MSRRLALYITLSTLAVLAPVSPVFAQHGGKAEPNRIVFARGASSATVRGTVSGDEQAEYAFTAKKGQTVTITYNESPDESLELQMFDRTGERVGIWGDEPGTVSCVLQLSGEFALVVLRAKPEEKGTSDYEVTLSIK
jgi:hypothetical protein